MGMLTVDQFETGLDVRKGASTSPASTLRVLNNAYVTIGKSIKKRPGLKLFTSVPLASRGLVAAGGMLHTFVNGLASGAPLVPAPVSGNGLVNVKVLTNASAAVPAIAPVAVTPAALQAAVDVALASYNAATADVAAKKLALTAAIAADAAQAILDAQAAAAAAAAASTAGQGG